MKRLAPIVAMLVIVLVAAASLNSLWRPTMADRGPASFSTERAMAHVEALAAQPRPAGSAAHRAARQYVVTTLRASGIRSEIRTTTATSTRYGVPYDAARVHNIVATIPGTDATRRIVLAAHYDTVLTSPGAGDDAAGIATLLEAGRALAVEYGGAPHVTLLFTDAEEIGAVGAETFLESAGFDLKRTTVLNFDARGTRGPVGLVETAGEEGSLVRALRRSGAPVVASSLLPALARRHGVGTDFRPFRQAGAGGLNFAIADGVARYHTPADVPRALDPRSLRGQGEAAVALVRELGKSAPERAGAVSYLTAPLAGLVVYPRFFDLLAAALATVLLVVWVWRAGISWTALGASALTVIAAVTLPALACHAAWLLVRKLGLIRGLADPYEPVPYRFAIVLLAAGTALGVVRAARRIGARFPTAFLPILAVVALWALALGVPGAAYLLAIPMPFVALHALVASRRDGGALVAALAAIPIVLVWAPVPYVLLGGLRLPFAWAAGAVTAFALLLCASVFERARVAVDGRIAAALLALAVVFAGIAVSRTGASPDTPRPVSVAYALDADAGRAYWVSDRPNPPFADTLPIEKLPRFLGEEGAFTRAATAPPRVLAGPEVQLVGDARQGAHRLLTLRVKSRRGAPWLHLFTEAGKVISATVDGRAFDKSDDRWAFRYIGAEDDGFELKLVVDRAAGPIRLTVVDQSGGVDAPFRLPPNTMYGRSWIAGTTLVRRSYAF